jgi:hypothetical protein
MDRVKQMAIAYAHPKSTLRGDNALKTATVRALDRFIKGYKPVMWWYHCFGIPIQMKDTLLALESKLSKEQLTSGVAILKNCFWDRKKKRYYNMTFPYQGANLTWAATVGLHYAAWQGDETLAKKMVRYIHGEIVTKVGGEGGIQKDWTFVQHGSMQSYSYGVSYFQRVGTSIGSGSWLLW